MSISPETIKLLNLSIPALRRLGREAGVALPYRASKWELARELGQLPSSQIDQLAGDWLHAGQTSVTWLTLDIPNSPPLAAERVRDALSAMYNRDPFGTDVRPEQVTRVPQLVDVTEWRDDKLVFTFVASKHVTRVIHNFEFQEVEGDEFFFAVFRLDEAVFEVRASHERAEQLANTWLAELMEYLE